MSWSEGWLVGESRLRGGVGGPKQVEMSFSPFCVMSAIEIRETRLRYFTLAARVWYAALISRVFLPSTRSQALACDLPSVP